MAGSGVFQLYLCRVLGGAHQYFSSQFEELADIEYFTILKSRVLCAVNSCPQV